VGKSLNEPRYLRGVCPDALNQLRDALNQLCSALNQLRDALNQLRSALNRLRDEQYTWSKLKSLWSSGGPNLGHCEALHIEFKCTRYHRLLVLATGGSEVYVTDHRCIGCDELRLMNSF